MSTRPGLARKCPWAVPGGLEGCAGPGPSPAPVFTFMFGSLWLHALYGSTRGVLLHTAFLAAAVLGSLQVWHLLPGREGLEPTSTVANVVSVVPVMFVTAGVARYLVRSLFAREQSQKRDAALVRVHGRSVERPGTGRAGPGRLGARLPR